ncbi:MAG: imidazole glycerol phosphate synthase subunit HisH [Eubacteriales bacterium]|nr:imidazole glycerol phosphate synthase subunit HisH [Eubacteriales bacterium]
MIAIVDYGVGNLFSLSASLAHVGAEVTVTGDLKQIERADRVILPGVGAFGDAANKLKESGLFVPLQEIAKAGTPFMGICLGMQLLLEKSFEYGEHEGLGLIPGSIENLSFDVKPGRKVPQMGWNALQIRQPDDPLLKSVRPGDCVYFVHSYYAKHCEAFTAASVEYDVNVPAVVRQGNVCGCQFHPEKSGNVGLAILKAFAEVAAC